MSVLQDLGSSITGNINKAMLCVKQIQKGAALGKTSTVDMRAKLLAGSGIRKSIGWVPGFSDVKGIARTTGFHVMQVKYNPSSIRFSTQAGSFMEAGPGGGGVNQITQVTSPAQTTMEVELIFDDVNIQDAFMWDKFSPTPGGIVSAGAGLVKKLKGGGYSVQTQIEGLVALITQSESRQAVFFWSELAFAGEITSVNAAYTMFNPSGHPIRGKVGLSIYQSETDAGGGDSKYWDQAFDKLFDSYDKNSTTDDTSWTDVVGNIFNF